jgi:oligopeptidase B
LQDALQLSQTLTAGAKRVTTRPMATTSSSRLVASLRSWLLIPLLAALLSCAGPPAQVAPPAAPAPAPTPAAAPAQPAATATAAQNATPARSAAPVAAKKARVRTVHGDTLTDDYAWLEDKTSPEVLAHLRAENAYTEAVMKPTVALQETLYREFLGRIKQTDVQVPVREGEYYYYSRTEEGKQYPIYCRKKGSLDAPEAVILDLNELAKGQTYVGIGAMEVSSDGNLLAYGIDFNGFRDYTLQVLDLRTGQRLPDTAAKVKTVAWAADNKTLFYTVDDHAKRAYRLHRHVLGTDTASDPMLYEETDERFDVSVWQSRSKQYVFLLSGSQTSSEVRYVPAARPIEPLRLIAPRQENIEYYPDHRGDLFYLRVNDRGRNFRVVTAPVKSPGRERWKELVPHSDDILREELDVFESHYVLHEQENGLSHIRIADFKSGQSHRLSMDEPVYTVFSEENPEMRTGVYRFGYTSLVTPLSVFEYDINKRTRKLLKQQEVLGGYDPARYVSERIWARASDGTSVPLSLVYRRGTRMDGKNPLLLSGYGSYGASYPVFFTPTNVSLLDRGVIVAIAHVRGGSEMGKKWHDQGRMLAKKNTFTDFIAAAEHLIAQGYTSSERLGITGRSAGGLLMGAVTNMRPDLFRAVISGVPFVDVINTMLNDDLPLTVTEYEEWGNPNIKEQYDYIKSYCPYTNIEAKEYPAILVVTSLNDSQVMYWEPAKYVARLRAHATGKHPVLLRIHMEAGHGGASGRYDRLRDIAVEYAFLLDQLGVRQ